MRPFRTARAASRGLRLATAILSRSGTYPVNEDAAADARVESRTLLAVADGLGGHGGGHVASRLAIDACLERFPRQSSIAGESLEDLVRSAHHAIQAAVPDEAEHSPRSTLVVLVADRTTAMWAHVGDTRLYFFRDGAVVTRTRDHSVSELLYRAGEIREDEISHHSDRNRLLQALGQQQPPKVAISDPVSLQAGDVFLLCSDGWWENVPEELMTATLREAESPQAWLARMAQSIEAAARTPQDNYTAAAAFAAPPGR